MSADPWKEIALYLADCVAATADRALCVKSTPKNERRRQVSICEMALQSIAAGALVGRRPSREEWVRDRLARIIADAAQPPEAP